MIKEWYVIKKSDVSTKSKPMYLESFKDGNVIGFTSEIEHALKFHSFISANNFILNNRYIKELFVNELRGASVVKVTLSSNEWSFTYYGRVCYQMFSARS